MPHIPLPMKRCIKRVALRIIGENYYIQRLVFEIMKSSGLYFFKDFSDHSLVLLPNDFIGDKLRRQGNFQREAVVKTANLLKQKNILPKQALIMEIGANIGTHTIYLERALSC